MVSDEPSSVDILGAFSSAVQLQVLPWWVMHLWRNQPMPWSTFLFHLCCPGLWDWASALAVWLVFPLCVTRLELLQLSSVLELLPGFPLLGLALNSCFSSLPYWTHWLQLTLQLRNSAFQSGIPTSQLVWRVNCIMVAAASATNLDHSASMFWLCSWLHHIQVLASHPPGLLVWMWSPWLSLLLHGWWWAWMEFIPSVWPSGLTNVECLSPGADFSSFVVVLLF